MNAHLAHLPATMYYLYYLPSRPAAMRAQRDDDQRRDRRRHGLEEPAAVEQGQRVGGAGAQHRDQHGDPDRAANLPGRTAGLGSGKPALRRRAPAEIAVAGVAQQGGELVGLIVESQPVHGRE